MQSQTHYQTTTEAKLIYWALISTYPIYAIGGLYITGSALGWVVLGIILLRSFVEDKNVFSSVPILVWIWVIGMLVMLLSLWIAHAEWSLGTAKTIKSTVGWAKGWALIAVFPLLGALVSIKPESIVRAACIICKHTAIFGLLTFLLYSLRIPGQLFVSPLQILGGAGDIFFTVSFYGMNPETGAGRWQFFAPWAPAAGFLSCILVIFCLQETNKKLRNWGVIGCVVMVLLSQSRAGLAIFIAIVPVFLLAKQLQNPWVLLTLGIFVPVILVLGEPLYELVMDSYQHIKESRPASTRVRTALENLAVQRWRDEAPIWGHGVVESGPKLVEFMPIGTHHTWFGLLFVKGLVGLIALAIPMGLSVIYFLFYFQQYIQVRAALCFLIVFVCYSFFENLEVLAYLYWPALFWIGMAFKQIQNRGSYV
ncbi:MAG: hypothetical protein ACI95X_003095 [Paraglaciecola sp.]|jgi:hypothetical protein